MERLGLNGFEPERNPAKLALEWGVRRMGEKLELRTRAGQHKPVTADFFPPTTRTADCSSPSRREADLVASARLAHCRGEIVEIRSSRDGETGEIREKRRVRSRAARASSKARDVQIVAAVCSSIARSSR